MPFFEFSQGMVILLAVGCLLLFTSLLGPTLYRLPVSTAMVYLAAGVAAGPGLLGWVWFDPVADSSVLKILAEAAVLVSLFVTGLKMDSTLPWSGWRPAVRLASLSMVLTIAAIAALAHWLLGLPWGMAVVLGAMLAPTDPVLASDIQVKDIEDQDMLRFSLSGEAGLNDGTAFPFIMLGLGLMGEHDLGAFGLHWLLRDVAWGLCAGIAVGSATGLLVGKAIGWLHGTRVHALQMNEFIAIGVMLIAYATAEVAGGYSFLSVFAAGVALRRCLAHAPAAPVLAPISESFASPDTAGKTPVSPAEKVNTVLEFNGQLERIAEFVMVVLVGAMLHRIQWSWPLAVFVVMCLVVVRPLVVGLTMRPAFMPTRQRRLAAWFGIRGIGSLYYLAFLLERGAGGPAVATIVSATLALVATSVMVHGISVTPLMKSYTRQVDK
jgi:sodium/hydrogen antiporter